MRRAADELQIRRIRTGRISGPTIVAQLSESPKTIAAVRIRGPFVDWGVATFGKDTGQLDNLMAAELDMASGKYELLRKDGDDTESPFRGNINIIEKNSVLSGWLKDATSLIETVTQLPETAELPTFEHNIDKDTSFREAFMKHVLEA